MNGEAQRHEHSAARFVRWSSIVALALALIGAACAQQSAMLAGEGEPSRPRPVPPLTAKGPDAAVKARARAAYAKLPLHFEANHGQTDPEVKFLARGGGYALSLTPTEAVLVLKSPATDPLSPAAGERARVRGFSSHVLRMKLVGADPEPQVIGLNELPGKANYFIGNDRSKWRTNVPTYARVRYQDVYPGIDLVYYGNQRQLEYDFIVAPGADPKAVKLAFEGAETVETDSNGDLVLKTGAGEVRLKKPYIYQVVNGVKQPISGSYVLNARSEIENPQSQEVSFQLAAYDTSKPLVIDPVLTLIYSTYFGSSANENSVAIAVDAQGSAYVTGRIFPPTLMAGVSDNVFVARLDPTGSTLIYSTSLGGSGNESGVAIAVDHQGNAYVTGETDSPDFPAPGGGTAPKPGGGGPGDFVFVAKLDDKGALFYSIYLGGGNDDGPGAIAVDSSQNAYVTGFSNSSADFPGPKGALPVPKLGSAVDYNAFVVKLDTLKAGADSIVYSVHIGGNVFEHGRAIAVDSSGFAYLTGDGGSDFPLKGNLSQDFASKVNVGENFDAFVVKLDTSKPEVDSLVYSTLLGGSANDIGDGIAVDSSGKIYVTGSTASAAEFPTKNAIPGTSCPGGFVAKFNPDLVGDASLLYSTCYAGGGRSIAVDSPSKNIYLGTAKLDLVANKLVPYPVGFFGGSIALDASCNVYATTGAAKPISGDSDAFVQKIGQGEPFAYISNFNAGTVSVIDAHTNSVVGNPIPVGVNPHGVAVHPDGRRVYVANLNPTNFNLDDTVSVIDTTKNTVIKTIPLGVNLNPIGVAVHPSGRWVYVANSGVDPNKSTHTISVIDTTANAVATTVELTIGTQANVPFGIAVSPDGTKVFVTNLVGNFVTFIDVNPAVDPPTHTVLDFDTTDEVQGVKVGPSPQGVAVSHGTRLYVANAGNGTVSVIDTKTGKLVDTDNNAGNLTTPIQVGGEPFAVAVHPKGDKVYVTDGSTNSTTLWIIDITQTPPAVTSVTVGQGPRGVAVTPDGAFVYVANVDDNTVSVLDVANNHTPIDFNMAPGIQGLPVGNGPVAFGQFTGALLDRDKDGDGISDLVDGFYVAGTFVDKSDPATDLSAVFNGTFTNEHLCGTVSGSINDPGGLTVKIESPAGLVVKTGPGSGQAKITYCDGLKTLAPGPSEVHPLTCGSLTARVVVGPIKILLDDHGIATVPSGTTVRVARLAPGQFEIQNLGGTEPIVVEFQGQVREVRPGESLTVAVDTTPPTTIAAASPAPNANGWNKGDVT
ncbi:MAG: SBBP repeat-containing protein, partial [Candidatus Rokubacteria bacterium]|nr:SBBP repeat-containing protein [Candidatus Rokubacteria bacterium]